LDDAVESECGQDPFTRFQYPQQVEAIGRMEAALRDLAAGQERAKSVASREQMSAKAALKASTADSIVSSAGTTSAR